MTRKRFDDTKPPRHSCVGKFIDNALGGATCYECGRSIEKGPPIDIGAAHLISDIKGYGLRSRGRG
jgi:hypothetical protein